MKTLIICAGDSKNPAKLKEYADKSDYIICADGGYSYALDDEIIPDILIGDFDSLDRKFLDNNIEKIKLPCEKDETDTLYALRYAIEKGADEVVIYGGIGDRFDHSYANMCILSYAMDRGISAILTDGKTKIYITDSVMKLREKKGTFVSVFSFSDISYNVNIKGLKYSLNNYMLKKQDIIGVSNEFLDSEAEISVEKGILIIICN